MRKIITLQIGQCGNQIGYEFWKRLAAEHGIEPDGVLTTSEEVLEDRKDIFFYPADDGRYVPRSILIDTEPGVIDRISKSEYSNFYNSENIIIPSSVGGGGAGNVWTHGHECGKENYEALTDVIRREVEIIDSLEGFLFTHSIGGGTGSGLGSFLIEKLHDEYKKATIMSYSVFSRQDSEVVVQPYNSILTLRRLTEFADAVVVLDNDSLSSIAASKLHLKNPGFAEINSLVSLVMAATTATLRFPSYSNNDLISLLAPLIPIPQCHFLMTGYTPISLETSKQVRTSVIDVMTRLLDPKNIMVSSEIQNGMFMSILNIIQGKVDPTEIHRGLRQVRENRSLRFTPWGPASLQLALSRSSPFLESPNRVSGLMLANHTSIRHLFNRIIADFTKIYSKKAYMQNFQIDGIEDEFRDSFTTVKNLIKEYEEAERPDFLNLEDE
uniref:Tubulin gamma chain n=1 Tax=Trichonympha agilis TaxID=63628 RepID=R4WHC6_9EUKA|nr:gamma-tubulin [Trichonympha agilis]